MALGFYGATLASDTYGVLRLKLMGCLVAIIQDLCAVENVNSMLSRSDIYYIAHVGGVLVSSQRRFSSNIFVILIWLTSVVSWLVYLTLKCLSSFLHLLVNPRNCLPLKDGATNFKLPNNAAQDQAARTLLLLINAVVIASPRFGTVRPQFVRLPRHDEAMIQPASRSDYVRQLASSVRARYSRMRTPHQASASQSHSVSSANRSSSALFNFPPPQEEARFGTITVHYDEWSEYIEPVAYSLQEQQRIVNWGAVRNLKFSGDGLTYMQCLRLFHTSERPIVLGDNMVFLYCPQCVFVMCCAQSSIFVIQCFTWIV